MASTHISVEQWPDPQPWRTCGQRYFSYKAYLRHQFGVRVQRVSVDARFTCPNVDGKVAVGGCVFCNNASFSPSRRPTGGPGPRLSIREQIDDGISRLQRRYGDCEHFIAYFQPATNTYAPVGRLEELYREALGHPQVIGLAVGTRPDCAGDDVLDLLTDLARTRYVSVEYGIQTIHNRSLDWMNRGHHHDAPDSDGEHSCAACHFAAAHGPVVQPEPMQLDGAVQSEGSEPRVFSYLISIAAVSRGPPAVSLSSVVTNESRTHEKRDSHVEMLSFMRGAVDGGRELRT